MTVSRSNSNNLIAKNKYKWNDMNRLLKNRPLKKRLSLSWILVQVFFDIVAPDSCSILFYCYTYFQDFKLI